VSFLKQRYPQFSQKQIKNFIVSDLVTVNGHLAKMHAWIEGDDRVELKPEAMIERLSENADVACQLIKKTKDYIFLSKGVGVHSVAHDYSEVNSVANWLLAIDEDLAKVGSPLESGLVQRLDFETSGLMVAARNEETYLHLTGLLRKRLVYKEYAAVVTGEVPEPGEYVGYAGKHGKSKKRVLLQKTANAAKKLSVVKTRILAIKRLSVSKKLLKLHLVTGYRHQIRAHMAKLGCPVVGDDIYGGVSAKRLMLHACEIHFKDRFGKKVVVKNEAEF
jgi:23S rRNA pseudouridine1911/1915/1917 synthase